MSFAPLKSWWRSQHSTVHTLCNNVWLYRSIHFIALKQMLCCTDVYMRYFINFYVFRPHSSMLPYSYCQRLHWFNLILMWMKVEVCSAVILWQHPTLSYSIQPRQDEYEEKDSVRFISVYFYFDVLNDGRKRQTSSCSAFILRAMEGGGNLTWVMHWSNIWLTDTDFLINLRNLHKKTNCELYSGYSFLAIIFYRILL